MRSLTDTLFFSAVEKPKELELTEQVAKLQAELDAAREQNNKWQEINNQMYRHMFTVLKDTVPK
jgi:hypothetical protein